LPAFEQVMGVPFYQHVGRDPELVEFFGTFMAHWNRRLLNGAFADVDFSRYRIIADIGGGDGSFLAGLLTRNADLTAILLDLPHAVAKAPEVLTRHGVADRVRVVPRDFHTDGLPQDCDAYLLKTVLHNLSDDKAVELLRKVRSTIGATGADLLVIEQVVAPSDEWDHAKFMDVDMLVLFGGRERTSAEWGALFTAAGFELADQDGASWSVLRGVPR
jgi:multifunctional cyclase/dehydratase/O-methyltransferase